MSRAFVKDHEDEPDRPIQRPISDAPNYVTPAGLELLRSALTEAERSRNERDIQYYTQRIASAIVVDPASQPKGVVRVGAAVAARDSKGRQLRVRIVGADEADPVRGSISWDSPVAQALLEHCAGDRVTVLRPAGPIEYRIEAVSYE